MKTFVLTLMVCAILPACGVKGPPVSPVREAKPEEILLDCSPYDEKCDRQDPMYKPSGKPGTRKKIK